MIKKFLIFIMSVVFSVVLLVFVWNQYRHFYQVGNMTFTVWKKWGGYCYVTPYQYWGITTPKDNYIRMSNVGNAVIYLQKDTLLIFHHPTDVGVRNNDISCHLSDYYYRHFTVTYDSISKLELWDKIDSLKLPYIHIEPRYTQTKVGKSRLP